MELGDQSRTALKRQAAAKKKASKAKKARRKYRKLDGDKAESSELDDGNEEELEDQVVEEASAVTGNAAEQIPTKEHGVRVEER